MIEALAFGITTGKEIDSSFRGIFGQEKALVEQFISSPESDPQRRMIERAVQALSDPTQDQYLIEDSIAGYIFENIAMDHLKKLIDHVNLNSSRQKFLFFPDEIAEIYKRIYGADSIRYIAVLQRVIKGVTIPDGLVFTEHPNTLQLTEIWDAKLGDSRNDNSNQRKSYRDGVVQRNLELTSPEGRTRFRQIISEVKPSIPDKSVSASSNLKVASYLYPIGSFLPIMGYPGEEVPISRPTIQGLKEMFIRMGRESTNEAA